MSLSNRPGQSGFSSGVPLPEPEDRLNPAGGPENALPSPFSMDVASTVLPLTVREQDVVEELTRICRHRLFASAPNLQRFLRFTVEAALKGEIHHLKEYTIAVSVFGRRPDFDPRTASIVRTQAGKLRSRLKEYYRTESSNRPVYIVLRPGSYVPAFEAFEPSDAQAGFVSEGGPSYAQSKGGLTLGVLPLVISPDDPGLRAVADLFESCLYSRFASEPGIQLIPQTSIAAVLRKSLDARQICSHLSTRWLIEGTILRGDAVSINLRRVSGTEGATRWAKNVAFSCDENEKRIAAIADKLADEISLEMNSSSARPARRNYQVSTDVRRYCEEGHHFCDRLSDGAVQTAADRFWRALSRDSDYSVAHAGLSRCQIHRAWLELASMPELWPSAKSAALRAISCDPDEASSQAAMAAVHCVFEWNWQLGASGFTKSLRITPEDPQILAAYALFALIPCGALDEAQRLIDRAVDLSPVNTFTRFALGWCQYLRKDFTAAISAIQHLQELCPPCSLTTGVLWRAHLLSGDARSAMEVLAAAPPKDAASPHLQALLACSYARGGDADAARTILGRLQAEDMRVYVPALYPALIHNFLGDRREALLYLERSVRERAFGCLWLKTDPLWDDLRQAERFGLLLDNLTK